MTFKETTLGFMAAALLMGAIACQASELTVTSYNFGHRNHDLPWSVRIALLDEVNSTQIPSKSNYYPNEGTLLLLRDGSNIVGWSFLSREFKKHINDESSVSVHFYIMGFKVIKNNHTDLYIEKLFTYIIKKYKHFSYFVSPLQNIELHWQPDSIYCDKNNFNVKSELEDATLKLGFYREKEKYKLYTYNLTRKAFAFLRTFWKTKVTPMFRVPCLVPIR